MKLYSGYLGSKVYIEDKPAPDGTYTFNDIPNKIIINDNKIESVFFIVKYKYFMIVQKSEFNITLNDKVFLNDGSIAPDGKYKLGFMLSGFYVKDGEVNRV